MIQGHIIAARCIFAFCTALYFLGYSDTHFTIWATCLSTTAWTPEFAWAFLNRKSEQWNPPGITFTGAFSVETSGPPGRNSEDIPEVFHGSNCLG